MLPFSVSPHKSPQVRQPCFQTIEREIPGSNLKILFTIQRNVDSNPIVQASIEMVVSKAETKIIPNVPIESFPSNSQTHINFDDALQVLRKNALDYVTGKIIFLGDPLELFRKWNKNRTSNALESQNGRKAYINKLKKFGQILKNSTQHSPKMVVEAYHYLGIEYLFTSKYKKALLLFQHMFTTAEGIEGLDSIRIAHGNLGNVYQKLGEIERAISHLKKHLIACLSLKTGVARAYCYLGEAHLVLCEYSMQQNVSSTV